MIMEMNWLYKNCKPGNCLRLIQRDDADFLRTMAFTKEGPELTCKGTAFIVIELVDDYIFLVPINSDLPLDMTIRVPKSSRLKFDLVNQEYYANKFPNRLNKILAHYPYLANY